MENELLGRGERKKRGAESEREKEKERWKRMVDNFADEI